METGEGQIYKMSCNAHLGLGQKDHRYEVANLDQGFGSVHDMKAYEIQVLFECE